MPRPKEFNPEAALDAALDVFWSKGYDGTSMVDLVEHLGINKPSIYATFGSKHDLYVQALRRYVRGRAPGDIEELSRPGPALPAVRAWIQRYGDEVIADSARRGCFVVNAATERLPWDRDVERVVEQNWNELEVALTSALLRARAQGELSSEHDPRALARFFMAVLQGLRVLGKREIDRERVNDVVGHALRVLG